MFCTSCGTENADNAKFCVNCGASLEFAKSAEDPIEAFAQARLAEIDTKPVPETVNEVAPSIDAIFAEDEAKLAAKTQEPVVIADFNTPAPTFADAAVATGFGTAAAEPKPAAAAKPATASQPKVDTSEHNKSLAVLILGIASIVLNFIPFVRLLALACAIVALIFANKLRKTLVKGSDDYKKMNIGFICAIVGGVLWIVGTIFILLIAGLTVFL